ncbi:MAG: DAK2 domain-containing protein [Oscillospiraceae bacterium]|nr:DAK2 domain-containing protein [Oscillospiraceae bacterium]
MKDRLDGLTFKDMIMAAYVRINDSQQTINELNVFPVPDGDTGTNMTLTMLNARKELSSRTPKTLGEACDVTASALLRGARGNSGVILSLLFRGFARAMKEKRSADAAEVAAALGEGVAAAYKAVMKPTEGTILTVSRLAAAAAAQAAEGGADVEGSIAGALEAARAALEKTVEQNPVLKKAGVVDAGGKGYVIILEAMLAVARGEEVAAAETVEVREKAEFSEFETEDIKFAYCTEFIVARETDKDPALLRSFLSTLGDSIVVVDDDEIIKVHVHNNCPGVVLTEALTYGSLQTVKIENMRNQHTELTSRGEEAPQAPAEPSKPLGVIAVCAGDGLESIFRDLGADGIVSGGQTMNPSTEDLVRAVDLVPAETVIILPNNKNIILAANQCDAITDKKVIVVPTTTVPQGISAMLGYDAEGEPEEVAAAMEETGGAVHTFSVTYAARDSEFDGLTMKEGDYLALLEGKLLVSGSDFDAIVPEIAASIAGFDPACVTVYYGSDASEADADALAAKLAEAVPDAEVQVLSGGQPVYYYVISAE